MDNCYCLIRLVFCKKISLYFFQQKSQTFNYPICFTAYNADALFKLMFVYITAKNISFGHSLYLGRELYKAELCLILGQEYIQN